MWLFMGVSISNMSNKFTYKFNTVMIIVPLHSNIFYLFNKEDKLLSEKQGRKCL